MAALGISKGCGTCKHQGCHASALPRNLPKVQEATCSDLRLCFANSGGAAATVKTEQKATCFHLHPLLLKPIKDVQEVHALISVHVHVLEMGGAAPQPPHAFCNAGTMPKTSYQRCAIGYTFSSSSMFCKVGSTPPLPPPAPSSRCLEVALPPQLFGHIIVLQAQLPV